MTAIELHEPVDIAAVVQRCRALLPGHPESDDELILRVMELARQYGAGLFLR